MSGERRVGRTNHSRNDTTRKCPVKALRASRAEAPASTQTTRRGMCTEARSQQLLFKFALLPAALLSNPAKYWVSFRAKIFHDK
jgi:hypothetical protein